MAKKRTSDAPPAAPRRRTAPPAATVPPVDGGMVPESVSGPRAPLSEAADDSRRDALTLSDTSPEASSASPSYDDIAREAYLRYLSRGGDHGRDFDDWLEAERELRSRR